jgi:3-hydroxyisobutyrate dehydrogenase-like beta-hydroxyacid dehydrogenase
MSTTIGFIGAGLMGRGLARSLIRKGHTLRIYNRTRAKAEEVAQCGVWKACSVRPVRSGQCYLV